MKFPSDWLARGSSYTSNSLSRGFRIDAELAHFGLQRGALHTEFGGGAGVSADLASGVVEGKLDGIEIGGFEGDETHTHGANSDFEKGDLT